MFILVLKGNILLVIVRIFHFGRVFQSGKPVFLLFHFGRVLRFWKAKCVKLLVYRGTLA